MFKINKSIATKRIRDGLTSFILLQQGDTKTNQLAITWVEVAPQSGQIPHQHQPEQVYIIIKGKGLMTVGEEQTPVSVGDLVYIPSNIIHGITNQSDEQLVYISASSPAFDLKSYYDTGAIEKKSI